ncbi:ABC transporter permease [Chryseolinea sp. T2]|uniref:ABC transporter permease n=1 Tax=Chryseolinea sp. T2 TaxID=3129255 RepID=UPI0030787C9D
MIRNYLSIALRNLLKHRFFTVLNIAGLTTGLAACLLLSVWIRHELSYDNFHDKADRLLRVSLEYSFGGQRSKTSVSPTALLPMLQKTFPEVELGARFYNPASYNPYIVRYNGKVFQEKKFLYADSTFFKVFTFHLYSGDPDKALTAPNSVLLTRSTAGRYFGKEDPIGKTIEVNDGNEYLVTGLVEDAPSNSIIQFDFIASFSSLAASKDPIWWSANYQTYIVTSPQADLKMLSAKTQEIVMSEVRGELGSPGDYVKYNFMPMRSIYLGSDVGEPVPVGSIQYVYVFGAVAVLVLLIACINYINLATARAADRAREVGIRKVVGAMRQQLFAQFIGESVIITLLSLCLALFFAKLAIPAFNQLTGKSFDSSSLFSPATVAIYLLSSVLVAVIAGAYPAFAITSFNPSEVLKGNFRTGRRGSWLRKSLVVFQFCISVVLVIGTLVVHKQLSFIQDRQLGYKRDNVLVIPLDDKTSERYAQIKSELLRKNVALSIGRAGESPTSINAGYSIVAEGTGNNAGMIVTATSVDETFIPTLGMTLVSGRNFNEADMKRAATDTVYAFVFNESALREIGLTPENAIGVNANMNGIKGQIIGVVKDFHFASLQKRIAPLILFNDTGNYNYLFISLEPGNPTTAVNSIRAVMQNLAPHRPFEFNFLDQQYNGMYNNEQRLSRVITTFAILTMVIACLGLLGLVAFAAAQKTKEIGIRKVMGASPSNIVVLITREFAKLVLTGIAIGVPLAFWSMDWWLDGFAYRAEIGAFPLLVSSGLCLLIAFGAASYQAIQASLLDPSLTLRSE